jgi:hypothetical protein
MIVNIGNVSVVHMISSPTWEVRHGAGIGLRSILKVHGSGIGMIGKLHLCTYSTTRTLTLVV